MHPVLGKDGSLASRESCLEAQVAHDSRLALATRGASTEGVSEMLDGFLNDLY